MKEFTVKELESFNGRKGAPSYTSYQGKVYDISQSSLWVDGEHMDSHLAGKDLTQEISSAPHGAEVFDRFTQVGTLKGFIPVEEDKKGSPETPEISRISPQAVKKLLDQGRKAYFIDVRGIPDEFQIKSSVCYEPVAILNAQRVELGIPKDSLIVPY
jgi:predicted heme/steroid binding protein